MSPALKTVTTTGSVNFFLFEIMVRWWWKKSKVFSCIGSRFIGYFNISRRKFFSRFCFHFLLFEKLTWPSKLLCESPGCLPRYLYLSQKRERIRFRQLSVCLFLPFSGSLFEFSRELSRIDEAGCALPMTCTNHAWLDCNGGTGWESLQAKRLSWRCYLLTVLQ